MLDDNLARQEVTLIGFVYEIEERGWVKGIAISTGDEAYIVDMNEQARGLYKEIENDVQITGYITKDLEGKNRILVTGYEVLPEEFEPGGYNLGSDDE